MPMEMDESVHKMECVGNEIWQREKAIKNFDCVINENMRWFNWPRKKMVEFYVCRIRKQYTGVNGSWANSLFYLLRLRFVCGGILFSRRIALRKQDQVIMRSGFITVEKYHDTKCKNITRIVWCVVSVWVCVCVCGWWLLDLLRACMSIIR